MTKTTDSRQIRLLVQGVLYHHGIDSLMVEADLSTALLRYLQARMGNRSVDKSSIREQILTDMKIAAEKKTKNEEMESRILKAMGLYVNDRWYQDNIIDFLLKKDEIGQTVEIYAEKCKDDPFNMPKFFQIAKDPSYLRDTWGLAFRPNAEGYNPQGLVINA